MWLDPDAGSHGSAWGRTGEALWGCYRKMSCNILTIRRGRDQMWWLTTDMGLWRQRTDREICDAVYLPGCGELLGELLLIIDEDTHLRRESFHPIVDVRSNALEAINSQASSMPWTKHPSIEHSRSFCTEHSNWGVRSTYKELFMRNRNYRTHASKFQSLPLWSLAQNITCVDQTAFFPRRTRGFSCAQGHAQ